MASNNYYNSIDITIEQVSSNNKAYLVDKRLVDILLAKTKQGNLEDLKNELGTLIDSATSKEDIFAKLDDYIYMDKVVQKATEPPKEE